MLQPHGAPSVGVPSRGVGIHQVHLRHGSRKGRAVRLVDRGMGESQQGQVVAGRVAQSGLAFHIVRLVEERGQMAEVHAQAAREVCHGPAPAGRQQPLRQCLLVGRCGLGGALLHRQGGREHETFHFRPSGQFPAGRLPALDLLEAVGQVHALGGTLECQRVHVVVAV